MATMIVLLRHIVKACNEAEGLEEALSDRLAEQGIGSPIDPGCLCQSGGSLPSYLVQEVLGENWRMASIFRHTVAQ